VDVPRLAPGDVFLVRLALDEGPGGWAADSDVLSDDERQRAMRFRFERDAATFARTRAGLRTVLGAFLGMSPASVRFRFGPFGKPRLEQDSEFDFNVTHSSGLALLAVACRRRVGIDVEAMRPMSDWSLVAFLSPRERAEIERLPLQRRESAFFRCWTRKEAWLKATGEGLHFAPERFSVSVGPEAPARLIEVEGVPEAPRLWDLRDLDVGDRHRASLAVEAPLGLVLEQEVGEA
jgi:4'-phosphopantetheinyl transferase